MGPAGYISGIQDRIRIHSPREIFRVQRPSLFSLPNVAGCSGSPPDGGDMSCSSSSNRDGSLFGSFLYKKTIRRIPNHHKPQASKQMATVQEVQDGIHPLHNSPTRKERGNVHFRLKKCILPRSNISTSSKISKVCGGKGWVNLPLSVPLPPIWFSVGSKSFYKTRHRNRGLSQTTGYHDNPISRRFPFSSRLSGATQCRFPVGNLHTAETRLGVELGKVTSNSKIKKTVSGCNTRFKDQKVISSRGKAIRPNRQDSTVHKKSRDNKRCNEDPWHHDSLYPMCQLESVPFPSVTKVGSDIMGQKTVFVGQGVPTIPPGQTVPTVVDGVGKPPEGCLLGPDSSSHGDNGRKPTRLGWPGTRKILPGTMEPRRQQQFIKPQRASCGLEGLTFSPDLVKKQTPKGLIGQRYNGSFPLSSGGSKASETTAPGGSDFRLGREIGSLNFSGPLRRLKKPDRGLPEQEKIITHRMGIKQQGFRYPVSTLGNAGCRPIRNQKKCKGNNILFPEPPGESGRDRCPLSVMEQGSVVCLSPSGLSTKDPQEDMRGQSSGDLGGSLLARKKLVSSPKETSSRRPVPSSRVKGPTLPGSSPPSEPRKSSINCMDPERQILKAKGLSEDERFGYLKLMGKQVSNKHNNKINVPVLHAGKRLWPVPHNN
ncbi:uncharacterized protein LOC143799621 [Ranitomeya variabilis]|uniref:uncharacterized protein LOC143799621 n=1 Tax=Ranitomeya variabilis TaxID=490064 RepID=UPI0040563F11